MQCDTCSQSQELMYKDLYVCHSCDLISSSLQENKNIYEETYYNKYEVYKETQIGKAIKELRYSILTKYVPYGSSVLDYGCGTGEFVELSSINYNAYGYDINPNSKWCDTNNLNAKYDCVTFWDSIEHTNSPKKLIRFFSPKYIIIALPCTDDYPYDDLTEWKHYRPHEHIHHYSEKALRKLVESSGYKILDVNFMESKLRKGFNGKNIITIIGEKITKD